MAPSRLDARREDLQSLGFDLQERKLKRDLRRFDEEEAEIDRKRVATASAEESRHAAALEEARQQRLERERQRDAEEERQQWMDGWIQYGFRCSPPNLPAELRRQIPSAIEAALSTLSPERSGAVVEGMVVSAVESVVAPWKRQQEVERLVSQVREALPFEVRTFGDFTSPTAWENHAMRQARQAIATLPPEATLAELTEAAHSAGRQVAEEYRAEQNRERERMREEQARKDSAMAKSLLISTGVQSVRGYLWRLFEQKDIDLEDVGRTHELEAAVRTELDQKLTGTETTAAVQEIVRDLVDDEVLL